MAMGTLEKIVLTGTALITLAGSLLACNKKDYPLTPTEPTPIVTTAPTQEPTYTLTPTPEPNNSFDFGKSLGLEAGYLRNVQFDGNAKEFIGYLASLPLQMRSISERAGLTGKLLEDKQISQDEVSYFKKIIGSYQK